MKTIVLITLHILMMLFKLCLPGGLRKIIAENIVIKQQLIVVKRSQKKCPNLSPVERLLFGAYKKFELLHLVRYGGVFM